MILKVTQGHQQLHNLISFPISGLYLAPHCLDLENSSDLTQMFYNQIIDHVYFPICV